MHRIDVLRSADAVLVERTWPEPPAGWIDGVFHRRRAVERTVPFEADDLDSGVILGGSCLVEESEPLDGDPNSIARDTYFLGRFLRVSVAACDWRLDLEVEGASCDQTLFLLVNGERRARFALAAGERRALSLTVPLSERCCEIGFAAVGPMDDASSEQDAEVVLRGFCLELVERKPAADPRIIIASDSTAQTYFDDERPQSGWGEWLYWYLYEDHEASVSDDETTAVSQARVFTGAGPTIFNKALGARGFRNYTDEHRFEKLLGVLRPGDAVVLQFGINDAAKARPQRYIALDEYASWIDRAVACITDRGGIPVLVTAPPQHVGPGEKRVPDEYDEYADATRTYAQEHGVALVDLRAEGAAYADALPAENRCALYLHADPRQYASHPDGIKDDVHLSTLGARTFAGIVARGLCEILPWAHLCDEVPADPLPVQNLSARNVRTCVGLSVDLRWEASGHADYFTVEKSSTATGRVYARYTTIRPAFLDQALPGQSRCVTYAVTAWVGNRAADAARVTVVVPADDDPCVNLD